MRPLLPIAAVLVILGVVALAAGGEDPYRLRLVTDDAAGLRKDFAVKVAGATAGKVTEVRLDDEDRAVAELELDAANGPIGTDARAAIRSSNLLGEKYVDLRPGDVRRPAPSGATLPPERVTVATELDDVLAVLRPDTRVALAAFLNGQGEALAGRGGDLAAALRRLPATLDEARRLVEGLATHNRAVGDLLERSDALVARLAARRQALGRLVASADAALDPLARERAGLGETVRRAPATLAQVRRSLVALREAAGPLAPAARGLTTSAEPLRAALRELPGFATAAQPTLRAAAAAAPDLARLGRRTSPVVRRLRPAAAQLGRTSQALEPVSAALDDGIADVLGMLQGWARAIQNRDAAGHVFRVSATVGQDALNKLDGSLARDRRAGRRRPRRSTPDTPAPRPAPLLLPQPSTPSRLPELPVVRVPGLPPIELPDLDRGADRVAGEAQALLDFLLKP